MNLPVCKANVKLLGGIGTLSIAKTIMSVYAALIIFLASGVVINKIDATSYASLSSGDENFKLQWTYNNSKLIFKMTCKTTGWCAVGFTETDYGKNMVNYDIAVAGYASGAGYIYVSCIFVHIYIYFWLR